MTTEKKNVEIGLMCGFKFVSGLNNGKMFLKRETEPEIRRDHLRYDSDANWQFEAIEFVNNLKNVNNSFIDVLHNKINYFLSYEVFKKEYPSGKTSNEYITHTFENSISFKKGKQKEAVFEALFQFSQYLKEKR